MKLLAEQITNSLNVVVEGKGDSKKHYLTGLFLEFDNKNKNGRVYRSDYHDPAVNKWISEKMNEGRGWGELDHPEGATINLKNVSHRVVEMHKEGTNWHGKSLVCNTDMGRIAMGLIESGGVLGSSSRGVGSLKTIAESVLEVQKDYKLITPTDLVSDPSAHGALMAGIMEKVEYFYDETSGSFLTEKSYELRQKLRQMSLKEMELKRVAIFESFINNIRDRI